MKKTIGIVLLLFMIFSVTACRPEPKVTYDENGIGFGGGKGVYWNTIIVYGLKFDASGESAEITIPEEYNGKPVLLIGDNHNDCRFVAYGDGVVDKLRWNPEDADETRVFELTLDIGKIVDICFSSNGPNTYFFKRSEDGKLILYKIHIHWK